MDDLGSHGVSAYRCEFTGLRTYTFQQAVYWIFFRHQRRIVFGGYHPSLFVASGGYRCFCFWTCGFRAPIRLGSIHEEGKGPDLIHLQRRANGQLQVSRSNLNEAKVVSKGGTEIQA